MRTPETDTLIAKIHALPATRIAEVEDFVDFLQSRPGNITAKTTARRVKTFKFSSGRAGKWPDGLQLRGEDLQVYSKR